MTMQEMREAVARDVREKVDPSMSLFGCRMHQALFDFEDAPPGLYELTRNRDDEVVGKRIEAKS